MREPQARRDQREIIVPSRGREARPVARRRPAPGGVAGFGSLAGFGALAGGAGRAILRHPGEVLGVAVVLGAVSMICLNALGYQMGRHPAPIFPKLPAKPALARAAEAPKPAAAAVAKLEAAKPEASGKSEASGKPEASKPEPARVEAARAPRDGIGEIIRSGEPAGAETTASVTTLGGLSVAQAQRALVKLGYGPLKADGLMGASTRAAIEKFERDRKLPVKGEPSTRTFRELATRAGASRG